MSPVKVALNGYGVIGNRVADAIQQQEDMALVGVCDVGTDYARGTLIRRASDPWEAHLDEIMNTVVPEKAVPSHHKVRTRRRWIRSSTW